MGWKLVGFFMSILLLAVSVTISVFVLAENSDAATTISPTTGPPIVSTPVGQFVGVVTDSPTYGGYYVSYRSIPFAKPPVGRRRFSRPEQPTVTDPTRRINSETYQRSCLSATRPNPDPNYGEDCLYLNIYVPGRGGFARGTNKLPVMVWLHGGGFVAGTTFPEPEKLVRRGGVVVVTVNYRLGVFGFLTTLSDDLPGNNGLWDQYLALQWVRDYIHFFHGDNSSITVWGESAGASCAALHAISPISSGLFHKAILQSGAMTSFVSRDFLARAHEFAGRVGCSNVTGSKKLGDCLRDVEAYALLQESRPSDFNLTIARRQIDFIWMPVVDGIFIPDEPLSLLSNTIYLEKMGIYNKDFLIGVLNNEGALMVQNFLNPIPFSHVTNVTFVNDMIAYLLHNRYGQRYHLNSKVKNAVAEFYSKAYAPENVLDLVGDAVFVVPAMEAALALSYKCYNRTTSVCAQPSLNESNCASNSRIFFYFFDYCPEAEDACGVRCMAHGLDVSYAFPRGNISDPVRQTLSDTYVDVLVAFARTSNPGNVTEDWPQFTPSTRHFLRFDQTSSVRRYLHEYRVNFWLERLPRLFHQVYPN